MFSDAELQGYEELVNATMYHKYTREASNVNPANPDDWNMDELDYSAAVVDVPCNFLSAGELIARDRSVTTIETPSLRVDKDDPIKIFDRITNIKDSAGTIVVPGPLWVESKVPAAGFGPVTNYIVQLRGTSPQRW